MHKQKFLLLLLFFSFLYAQPLEKVSIQLHWKYQFEFAGFIAAIEKGYYKDVNLDVSLKEFQFGQNIIEDVLNNKTTYGIYNSNILLEYLNKKPLKLLASFYKKSALVLITKPDIKYINDLIGKKIMAAGYTDFKLNFEHIFQSYNIDINTLTLLPHTFNIEAFKNEKVDAMTAFITDQPFKLDQSNTPYNIIDPSSFGIFNLQLELFTTKDEVNSYPKRTENFKKATIKGWKYALNNPNEIIDIILDKYNTQNLSRQFLEHEAMMTERIILPKMYKIGSIDQNFLMRQIDFLSNNIDITHTKKKEIIHDFIFFTQKEQEQIDNKYNYKLLKQILPIILLLILFILYRHWLLKKYNNKLLQDVKNKTIEYKNKNEALKSANENFVDLFNTAIEAIGIFDENFKLVEINLPGKKMYHCFDDETLLEKTIYDFVPEYELDKVYESLSKNKTEPYELDLYRYNKKTFPALASGKNIIRNEKTYRIVTIVDLTHIKQKDKLIQEQSKLAQMGEMLSMIAHQWRQPLSSISATSEAIRLKATLGQIDTPMLLELSKKITTYTTHLNNTIDDFRDFYKKDKIKELTTLDKLCNKSLNIIEGTIKNNKITLLKEYNSHTLINIYSNELTQVILSLLQNGVDKLTDKDYENPTITIKTFEDNKFLYLDISDNGNKIEDTILNKIFEPYFSTKLKQNGTGLGLYMAKRIIEENCNGNLYVNNKENQVTFTIKLLKV